MNASYTLGAFDLVFFDQYRMMAIINRSTNNIAGTHILRNDQTGITQAVRLYLDTSRNSLEVTDGIDIGSVTIPRFASYNFDNDKAILFTNSALIIGTGDVRNGITQRLKFNATAGSPLYIIYANPNELNFHIDGSAVTSL